MLIGDEYRLLEYKGTLADLLSEELLSLINTDEMVYNMSIAGKNILIDKKFYKVTESIAEEIVNKMKARLTVPATVVSKRTKISHRNGVDYHHRYYSSTTYYITFQVESGERMEFHVTGQEYGMLIEGDQGMLFFQGTRYLGFQR